MADNNDKNETFAAADAKQSTTSNNHSNMNGGASSFSSLYQSPSSSTGNINMDTPSRRTTGNINKGTPMTRPRIVKTVAGDEFEVWPMSRDSREANDIIHGTIKIPPAVQVILDSPPVQRLANLKQLGCAFNAYPCCTHTRKEHSLGVMELAGRLCTRFMTEQKQLGVTAKDVLCLRMAGLCHDLGHGPFSHAFEAFLHAAHKSEKEHPDLYEERNAKFKEEYGIDMPKLKENYEHENTSLMMIDAALSSIGFEIDWDNLDKPLKQIGSGIDREKFGVDVAPKNNRGSDNDPIFTSRDWVFIKECILGKPLDEPHAPEKQTHFHGRSKKKEFLFDIVSNRHNGLDVDKIDYFHRDSMAAFGSCPWTTWAIRDAVVARGECTDPKKSSQFKNDPENPIADHLMICYPKKHVNSAMTFFSIRMANHEKVYTHKKTKAAELQMVDVLLEADKHYSMMLTTQVDDDYGMKLPTNFDKFPYRKLPISRAFMYPRLFLRLDDTIVSIIENKAIENSLPQLGPLRQLLNERRAHKVYKRVGEVEVGPTSSDRFWNMSEAEIKDNFMRDAEYHNHRQAVYKIDDKKVILEPDDIIVEKRELHYGRKEKNPVSDMRFLSKSDQANLSNKVQGLPLAVEVVDLPMNTPRSFVRRTIRFFCRSWRKVELVTHCFNSWKCHTEDSAGQTIEPYTMLQIAEEDEEEEDDDHTQSESQHLCTQPDDNRPISIKKRKYSAETLSQKLFEEI